MKRFLPILLCLILASPSLAMERNVASQKVYVQEIDSATGAPKTGDSANLTLYVAKDGGSLTALGDTSATELSSSNAPGIYWFDVTQAETNAASLEFSGKSSTSGCYIIEKTVATTPANHSLTSVDSSGNVASNTKQWNGTNVPSPDTAGYPKVTIKNGGGNGELKTSAGEIVNKAGSVAVLTFDSLQGWACAGGLSATTDAYKGYVAILTNKSLIVYPQQKVARLVTSYSYDGDTGFATIGFDHSVTEWTLATGDTMDVYPVALVTPLTAQQVADALKLAPAVGSPAAGSVYAAITAAEQHSQFLSDFAQGMATATSGAPTVEDSLTAQGYTTTRAAKLDNLDQAVSTTGQSALTAQGYTPTRAVKLDHLDQDISNVQIEAVADHDFVPVGDSNTWKLTRTSQGLTGVAKLGTKASTDAERFAVDFNGQLAPNGYIITVDDPVIVTGTAGGITFSSKGTDGVQAKFMVTPTTAGTYVIKVAVTS
jgi:hypothetical protein